MVTSSVKRSSNNLFWQMKKKKSLRYHCCVPEKQQNGILYSKNICLLKWNGIKFSISGRCSSVCPSDNVLAFASIHCITKTKLLSQFSSHLNETWFHECHLRCSRNLLLFRTVLYTTEKVDVSFLLYPHFSSYLIETCYTRSL